MKLTTEQLQCIDQTLIKKGIKFDDIKIEVIDHIASEIECEIETNQKPFLEAFNQVFERWKPDFELTTSFFSFETYYPKLVSNKIRNQIKVELIATAAILSLLLISLQVIIDSAGKVTFIFWLRKGFVLLYFLIITLIVFLKYLNTKSKLTSTYKYRSDNQFPVFIICSIIFFDDTIPESIISQNLLVLLIGTYFVSVISTLHLCLKHYKFHRQLS
jgi:hypothetical protein